MALLTQTGTQEAVTFVALVAPVWAALDITLNPISVTSVLGQAISVIPSLSKVVNGFFKDESGAAISRNGYAIDRATGTFITSFTSDPVTGAFSFYAPSTNPVIIILVPNSGDGRNAVTLDNIVPI